MYLPYRAGVAKCMPCIVAIDHMTPKPNYAKYPMPI